MLPNSKIYVMDPKDFMGYFERGSHHKLNGSQFGNNSRVNIFFHRFMWNKHGCHSFTCVV
jgi:hypothetical protein